MRATVCLVVLSAPWLSGCFERDDAGCELRYDLDVAVAPAPRTVDLLLVVDDSSSMADEQALLGDELPRLVRVLSSGDRDEDGAEDFPPVGSIHVGIVTGDMGAGPAVPAGMTIPTCRHGLGDDGILRAVGDTSMAGCVASYPPIFDFTTELDDPAGFARDVACVALAGTDGCSLQQGLEAMLKAVAPSVATADYVPDGYLHIDVVDPMVDRPPIFAGGTPGHGDRTNAGFVRAGSVLALVLLSDEEDCSVPDYSIFYDDPRFSTVGLSMRCFTFSVDWLYPTRRYVENFVHLRDDPSALVFAAIVGVPTELASASVTGYDRILADPRMIETPDVATSPPTRLLPSCTSADGREAFPSRRTVEVARGLALRGARTTVQSICADDFGPAVSGIVDQVAAALGGTCLRHPLRRADDGTVACELVEVVPHGVTCTGTVFATEIGPSGEVLRLCRLEQLTAEEAAAPGAPPGWFYDTSPEVLAQCTGFPPGQRVGFSAEYFPPLSGSLRLRCDDGATETPFAGIGSACVSGAPPGEGDPCPLSATPSGDADLLCDAVTSLCQAACSADTDCASAGLPGWTCDRRPVREVSGRPFDPTTPYGFCVNPTCN